MKTVVIIINSIIVIAVAVIVIIIIYQYIWKSWKFKALLFLLSKLSLFIYKAMIIVGCRYC